MNTEYTSISQFVECKSKIIGKIAAYDLIIEAMESAILDATTSGMYNQVEVDDGQMKVRTNYRNITDMNNALLGMEQARQRYIQKYNGRVTVLRGGNL